MKTVYVDVLVTVNIFIDFFLLVCTKRFLNIKTKLVRVILGSLLGGVLSLSALLPRIPAGLNIALDAAFASLIIFVTFGKTEIKNYIKRVAVYFASSFIFCGIMIFVYTAFQPGGMGIYNDIVYFDISPVLLIILTLICYFILRLIKRLCKGEGAKSMCRIELEANGTRAEFSAIVDTGCSVKEPFSSDYVIITEKSLVDKVKFDEGKFRIIPFDSLGGSGILMGYKPDIVRINGKEAENIYIGISEGMLKSETKAIAPYDLIKNI